jgi:hypothetical protein
MPNAKATDPQTSHDAARSVKNLTETQKHILWIYDVYGSMVDDKLVYHYQKLTYQGIAPRASLSGIKTRRHELVTAGKVQDSGSREKLESGRKAIVWELS